MTMASRMGKRKERRVNMVVEGWTAVEEDGPPGGSYRAAWVPLEHNKPAGRPSSCRPAHCCRQRPFFHRVSMPPASKASPGGSNCQGGRVNALDFTPGRRVFASRLPPPTVAAQLLPIYYTTDTEFRFLAGATKSIIARRRFTAIGPVFVLRLTDIMVD